jgi:hypothetical protein
MQTRVLLFLELRQNIYLSKRNETKFSRNKTKFLRNEAKFRFNFCSAKRNETKFRIILFRETSEIFAKQARLSYRFVFREIKKIAKIKNPSRMQFLLQLQKTCLQLPSGIRKPAKYYGKRV